MADNTRYAVDLDASLFNILQSFNTYLAELSEDGLRNYIANPNFQFQNKIGIVDKLTKWECRGDYSVSPTGITLNFGVDDYLSQSLKNRLKPSGNQSLLIKSKSSADYQITLTAAENVFLALGSDTPSNTVTFTIPASVDKKVSYFPFSIEATSLDDKDIDLVIDTTVGNVIGIEHVILKVGLVEYSDPYYYPHLIENTRYNLAAGRWELTNDGFDWYNVFTEEPNSLNVIKDMVGAMVTGNTELGVDVTYDSIGKKIDFKVPDTIITLSGDVSGSATMYNLGNVGIHCEIQPDSHSHSISSLPNFAADVTALVRQNLADAVTGNIEDGLTVTFNQTSGKLDFNAADFLITLTGEVKGSATVNNLGDVTINTTLGNVASHSHDTLYYSKSQSESLFVPFTGGVINGDLVIHGNIVVDGNSTTLQTAQLHVDDNMIVLNSSFTSGTPTLHSGFEVKRGDEISTAIYWDEDSDVWKITDVDGVSYPIATENSPLYWQAHDDYAKIYMEAPTDEETALIFEIGKDLTERFIFRSMTMYGIKRDIFTISNDYISVLGNRLIGVANPVNPDHAANKNYIDIGLADLKSWVNTKLAGTSVSDTSAPATDILWSSKYIEDHFISRTKSTTLVDGITLGSPTSKFDTIYADTFNGTVTNATKLDNLGSLSFLRRDVSDAPTSDNVFNLGSSTKRWRSISAVNFYGHATTASYADLAEKYTMKNGAIPGHVVVISDNKDFDCESSTDYAQTSVLGVVSTNPAFRMNSECENGEYIALRGRVPCFVKGPIKKGEPLVTAPNGAAVSAKSVENIQYGAIFAKALESIDTDEIKKIEVVVL